MYPHGLTGNPSRRGTCPHVPEPLDATQARAKHRRCRSANGARKEGPHDAPGAFRSADPINVSTDVGTMPAAFFGHGSPMNAIEHNRYTEAWRHSAGRCLAPRDPGHLGALVHQRDRGDRDGRARRRSTTSTAFPRSCSRSVPGARDRPSSPRRSPTSSPHLGRSRRRQLGHRPRHLVGARARISRGRHPGRATVDQRSEAARIPPRPGPSSHPCETAAC